MLTHLITDAEAQISMAAKFAAMDEKFADFPDLERLHKQHIATILVNDTYFTKLKGWEASPEIATWKNWRKGSGRHVAANRIKANKFIQMDIKRGIRPEGRENES